jgi:hypothetical protein
MNTDTAGNPIIEMIKNCDCGITGGCKKCNPDIWANAKKKEIKEWEMKFNKDFEERNKELLKRYE